MNSVLFPMSPISDICERVSSGGTPSRKRPKYFSDNLTGHLWVKSKELLDCSINETEEHITDLGLKNSSAKYYPANTVLMAMYGANVGQLGWLRQPATVNQAVCGMDVNRNVANFRYVFYALLHCRSDIIVQARGAAQQNLNQDIIRSFEIPLPPLTIQRKIAAVLSAYDDLIENNTRRIQILEEMAQSIYREWFVHFRFPGHENVRMVDSGTEWGEVPEGWIKNLADYVDFKEGPGLRNWQYRDEGVPFLNIRTLINNDIDFSKVKYLDEEEVNQRYSHFLLQPYDHVVSSSGTIGRLVTIQSQHLPLMLNTSIIRMRPKNNRMGRWQLKHFLISDYFQNQIYAHASGVAQKNYGPMHLKQMWIISPDEDVAIEYENIVDPMEELIGELVRKSTNLHATRDLLLPKLVSGEVDVSGLEISV